MGARFGLSVLLQWLGPVRSAVGVGLLVYLVASAGIVAVLLLQLRDEAIVSGEKLTSAFAQLSDQQVTPIISDIRQALADTEIQLAAEVALGTASESSIAEALGQLLRDRPYLREIRVIGRTGSVVYDSNLGNVGRDLSSRPHFIARRDRPETGFRLEPLFRSASTGELYIPAVVTLRKDNGDFAGILVAAVEPGFFERAWTLDSKIPGIGIALLRRDGVLLMRAPVDPRLDTRSLAQGVVVGQLREEREFGVVQGLAPGANEWRMLAYRRLSAFPDLVVVVSQPLDVILAGWRRTAWLVAVGWLLGSAALGGAVIWLVRVWSANQAADVALRQSREQYRLLFASSPYPLYVTDRETLRIVAVNDEAVRTSGWSRDELLAMRGDEVYPPEDLPQVMARREAFSADETRTFQGVRQLRKDGTVFDVEMATRLIEYDGRPASLTVMIDVTERQRAERARRAAEERLRLLFDASPYPIYVTDCESLRIVAVSDEAVRLQGWSRDEFLTMTADDLYPPEDRQAAALRRKDYTSEETQVVEGLRYRCKDGTVFDVEMAVRVIDYNGRPATLAMVMDVTERRRAERARRAAEDELRQSQERYRLVFAAHPYPMALIDRDSRRFLAVNDATVALYGWSREEFLAMTTNDLLMAEDMPAVVEQRRKSGPSGVLLVQQRRHRRKDGSVIDVEISTRLITVAGHPTTLAIAHDVTAKKQADAHRLEAEHRLRAVMDSTADGLITIDDTGEILSMNRAAEQQFGYAEAEVVGRNVRMLMPEPIGSSHGSYLAAYMKTGRAKVIGIGREVVGARRDGTEFPIDLSVGEIPATDSRRHFVGTVRDITAKKAAELELHQAQKMETVGQLTGGIAHDFNNILTVILASVEALQDEEQLDVRVAKSLDSIARSVHRASDLTQSLLAFSRKQPLRPLPIIVNDLVTTTGNLLRRTLGEDIELDAILADDLWVVDIDRAQLESALVNLCINARDAMPGGGRLLIETRNVTFDDEHVRRNPEAAAREYVQLSVGDSGCGMAPDVQARVFEPFFTTKGVGKGTGLGLSMVYGFVTQSGGFVRIESAVGQGATFRLLLPRSMAAQVQRDVRREPPSIGGVERILVVEDETDVRASVVRQLKSLGYDVTDAANGGAGIAAFEAAVHPFDLLLTDVVMPGQMNGRALADEVCRRWPSTKVVFMSGYTGDALTRDGRLDAGVRLLGKPFRRADLASAVRQALDPEVEVYNGVAEPSLTPI